MKTRIRQYDKEVTTLATTVMQMYRSKLAEYFSRARVRNHWSQAKVAREFGVSEDGISHCECRRRPFNLDLLLGAARKWGGQANDLATQTVHEATGMYPAWPDGSKFDSHPLARLICDRKEDSEADEAVKETERLLILAEWDEEAKQRAAGLVVEILEGCAARIDFLGALCDKGQLDLMALWAAVHERRKSAGIVRRVA